MILADITNSSTSTTASGPTKPRAAAPRTPQQPILAAAIAMRAAHTPLAAPSPSTPPQAASTPRGAGRGNMHSGSDQRAGRDSGADSKSSPQQHARDLGLRPEQMNYYEILGVKVTVRRATASYACATLKVHG